MATSSTRSALTIAGLAAALVLGAGLGAAAFSMLDGSSTVVRQVTVTTAEPAASATTTIAAVYDRASKGVVEISATSGGGLGGPSSSAQGSGFVYDEQGHVVTNQHVVAGSDTFRVSLWNGKEYRATLVGADPSTDLAVLKIEAPRTALEPLALANSADVSVGDPVLALGSPFGLEGSITAGIVSAVGRTMRAPNGFSIADSIQTDAPINSGSSGGPLIDAAGTVIGINAQIESSSGGNEGVGFTIPSATARRVADALLAGEQVTFPYLGAQLTDAPSGGGAEIAAVQPDSPAEAGGLEPGDVVTAVDGRSISSADELVAAVAALDPGDVVTLTVGRAGGTRDVDVTLGTRPA